MQFHQLLDYLLHPHQASPLSHCSVSQAQQTAVIPAQRIPETLILAPPTAAAVQSSSVQMFGGQRQRPTRRRRGKHLGVQRRRRGKHPEVQRLSLRRVGQRRPRVVTQILRRRHRRQQLQRRRPTRNLHKTPEWGAAAQVYPLIRRRRPFISVQVPPEVRRISEKATEHQDLRVLRNVAGLQPLS